MYTSPERQILHAAVDVHAKIIRSEDYQSTAQEYDHLKSQVGRTIGMLAGSLIRVGDEQEGMQLGHELLERTDISAPRERFSAWYWAGGKENTHVRDEMYASIKLPVPEKAAPTDTIDYDVVTYPIADLIDMGDFRAIAASREKLSTHATDDDIFYRTRWAVKLYHADPSTSVDLVLDTARQAKARALELVPDESPDETDDTDPFKQITKAFISALGPNRSELESVYAQTDIALRYFAEEMLKQGNIEAADLLQQEMISGFYGAEVSSVRVALGLDPDDKYAESVLGYMNVHGDMQAHHLTDMTTNLIKGGYAPIIDELSEALFGGNGVEFDVTEIPPQILSALYGAGKKEAYDKLMDLYPRAHDNQWKYPDALLEMGKPEEAFTMLRNLYYADRSYHNGLALLRNRFDSSVWRDLVTNTQFDRFDTVIDIVERNVNVIELLSGHIKKSESHGYPHSF